MKSDLTPDVSKWVDSAISGKAPIEAGVSWWAEALTRPAFDAAVVANLARMNRSKYGRLASPMGSRGLGHDSE